MLPFYGLEAHNIQDPSFQIGRPIDCFIATTQFVQCCTDCRSDGVTDSFPDRNIPIADKATDLKAVIKTIIQKTYDSHVTNKMDPDDVAIGTICSFRTKHVRFIANNRARG